MVSGVAYQEQWQTTASARMLSPGALSTGEAISRVTPSMQASSSAAGVGRAVNLEGGFPDALQPSPPRTVSMPWPEPPVQLHHISCSYCLGIRTPPGGVPHSGYAAGRGHLPLVGGSLPRDQHKDGLGQGRKMALNPSVRLRRAADGGGQQAGMMGKEGGAGIPCSSSPPAWRLVQCIPHRQATGGCDLCEQLGRSRRTSLSQSLQSSQTDRQWLASAESKVPTGVTSMVGELEGAMGWRPR